MKTFLLLPPMARILIDGYNLLAVTGHPDRDRLVRDLSQYQKAKGHQVTIVFDGTHGGRRDGDRFHSGGVEIIFSPLTVTADDTIEEMLMSTSMSGSVVVSSDRKVQSAAHRANATSVSSQEFASRLRSIATAVITQQTPPWLEGRTEDDRAPQMKKGAAKRRSKQERKRKKVMERL